MLNIKHLTFIYNKIITNTEDFIYVHEQEVTQQSTWTILNITWYFLSTGKPILLYSHVMKSLHFTQTVFCKGAVTNNK